MIVGVRPWDFRLPLTSRETLRKLPSQALQFSVDGGKESGWTGIRWSLVYDSLATA